MSTLVFLHAHPDDEATLTGGSMARAAAEGHRVVLVVATGGEHGEVPNDLAPGETLVDRRRAESARAAAILGVARVEWLGYADSGMTGWEQNGHAASFLQAPLEEAAGRLAALLREESADVLVTYDWHGNYGHPDHIKVHTVGHRAADLAGTATVFEATMSRDHIKEMMAMAAAAGENLGAPGEDDRDFDPDGPADDGNPFGMPADELTHAVDVAAYITAKRDALACHASQVTDTSFFMQLPIEAFTAMFGTEWYIKRGAQPGLRPGWLLD